ncbi:MAG: CDP-glucose 4,6-dehydratase [Magnetococcales bacterium]|nr:CDP-glucose 4,6-dehydratase [Magnetococcales bacterium]
MFNNVYSGKKVFVTGHTGFKGSWLTKWLLQLGAQVIGYSKDIPTAPALFDVLGLEKEIRHILADIRNLSYLKQVIKDERPDFVFHLAAQAIVSISYKDPCETMTSNAIGTMNVLESLRALDAPCVAILITSDKCYDNVEWVWGYRETDGLGGKDVYSGSKGAAEIIIKSYLNSFFSSGKSQVRLGIGRAGNVIGGGDWAKDRIVADIYRSWSAGRAVDIRSPSSTRPWQHVLEPLSGYLNLGQALIGQSKLHGEAFNFGPRAEQNRTVINLLEDLSHNWGFSKPEDAYNVTGNIPFHEASLLKLNCDKALYYLRWEPTLDYKETVDFISHWYNAYYHGSQEMVSLTLSQLTSYSNLACVRGRLWAQA